MRRRLHVLFIVIMFLLHGFMAYGVERQQTVFLLISFFSLNLFWFLSWFDLKVKLPHIVVIGLLMRAVYLFATPALSDDVFRYLWDGHLCLQGVSPFQFTPLEWMKLHPDFNASNLFPLLNSKGYFSVYPPLQQTIYTIVAWVAGSNISLQLIMLRAIVILAEFGSILLILKLLKHYRKPLNLVMLYALNPLIIIEFTGNLHGEVFMVFFMLLFLWWHATGKMALAAVAFAMAVLAKLLPLMFLPAILLRLKLKQAIVFMLMLGLVMVTGTLPFITPETAVNLFESLQKYFVSFEFNGSIYYLIREFGYWWKGWNIIHDTGKILPVIVLLIILGLSFWKRKKILLPTVFMFSWMVYYLFATTVNPWYIAVLVPFSIFTTYRSAFLWTLFVPLSYHAYWEGGVQENTFFLFLEYVPVFGWMLYETGWLIPLERFYAKRKAVVKKERLQGVYSDGDKVLDVGVGNGAVSCVLQEAGVKVFPVDVVDKSLFSEVRPTVYDGLNLKDGIDQKVDAVQMITMLHHVDDPDRLIRQASEIAPKLVVMEDVFSGPLQEFVTHVTDSIVNLEFIGHPHTNRTDEDWRATFNRFGYEVKSFRSDRFLLFFRQNTYVLEKGM